MRIEIQLTQGQIAVIDESDYDLIKGHNWMAAWSNRSQTYYAVRVERGEDGKKHTSYMHRDIMQTPKGLDTDHRDNNGLHNWRDNLQILKRSHHGLYSRGRRSTTGFRGVRLTSDPRYKHKRYMASFFSEGRRIFVGCFATAKEASEAREAKAKEVLGDLYSPPRPRKR